MFGPSRERLIAIESICSSNFLVQNNNIEQIQYILCNNRSSAVVANIFKVAQLCESLCGTDYELSSLDVGLLSKFKKRWGNISYSSTNAEYLKNAGYLVKYTLRSVLSQVRIMLTTDTIQSKTIIADNAYRYYQRIIDVVSRLGTISASEKKSKLYDTPTEFDWTDYLTDTKLVVAANYDLRDILCMNIAAYLEMLIQLNTYYLVDYPRASICTIKTIRGRIVHHYDLVDMETTLTTLCTLLPTTFEMVKKLSSLSVSQQSVSIPSVTHSFA